MKKEMKKILFGVLFLFVLTSMNFVFAQTSDFNVCCEKTKSGAWCQNTQADQCDDDFRVTPTSCDATSFCEPGICIDSEEGICAKNTPQRVCELTTGTWVDAESEDEIPQCTLGCCILGDQASFVTLTRCKRISRVYGLETNFRSDITDETQCILTAHASDKGACVFDSDGEKTCRFSTRQECLETISDGGNVTSEVEFFKDFLCSADELATNCGPTRETICVEGLDEVYFKDSCGNPANIYDANRIYDKDPKYWRNIVHKANSCEDGNGNINSRGCGNCKYLGGSICGESRGKTTYGSNYCRDLNCYDTENGRDYKNGESWCITIGESGQGLDPVGSRHFRHVCVQGEEIVEPCEDFRNEVCIEQVHPASNDFNEAACRVNRWDDCIDQFVEEDCLNADQRDCFWLNGLHYDGSGGEEQARTLADVEPEEGEESFFDKVFGSSDEDDVDKGKGILRGGSICIPNNSPGLEFWQESNAKDVCSLGNSIQTVYYKEDLFGNRECDKNCEVTETGWVNKINNVCVSLGDCGAYVNINNVYTDDGVVWKQNGKRKSIQTGLLLSVQESASGGASEVVEEGSFEEFEEVNQEGSEVFSQ